MKAARVLHPDKVTAGASAPDGSAVTAEQAATAEALFTLLASLYEAHKDRPI